jgi:hypothetical protein
MKSGHDTLVDVGYDEVADEHSIQQPSVSLKKSVVKKKSGKSKRYIPRVWCEGRKMFIRGKAELKQSNDEIYNTIEKKAKDKKEIEFKVITDVEVRSGAQTTLSNFFNSKTSKPNNDTIDVRAIDFKESASSRCSHDDQPACKGVAEDVTSEDDDLNWVLRKRGMPIIVDWKATMKSDPDDLHTFNEE